MSNAVLSKIRIFPLLIAVAVLALGLKSIDLYTGFDLLGEVALAQDATEKTEENADKNGAEDTANAALGAAEIRPGPLTDIGGPPGREEMEIITQLRQRRLVLDERGLQLDLQQQLLASTEKMIDSKIKRLEVLETKIKEHLRLFDEREDGQLKSIVEVYEKMKPKDAAPRFEALPLQTQLDLVTRMKSAKVAALMGKMTPNKASTLTKELATRAAPPSIDEMQRSGS